MSLTGGLVLYATLWFLSLFLLIPFGQRSQADAGDIVPGTPRGAPHQLRVGRLAVLATLLSAAIFAVIAAVIWSGWITRADIMEFGRPG
ncbi:DUF1467 family protein [Paracoccus endophyticus]|uniref:DUF1467 family protein n=1 Tax=Paracoccus endophyticus TaxID=2233774 RepID=UPI000DD927B3|nr:DUF1467 family protein [Paracoccus endophyticus]